jgi:hypothetical protein
MPRSFLNATAKRLSTKRGHTVMNTGLHKGPQNILLTRAKTPPILDSGAGERIGGGKTEFVYLVNSVPAVTSMTYPSGRVVNFNYATGGGCCNSRLASVVDQTTGHDRALR